MFNEEQIKQLPPHQQRVVYECHDLEIKINALNGFIATSSVFPTLCEEERADLVAQGVHMTNYLCILLSRISRFPKPSTSGEQNAI